MSTVEIWLTALALAMDSFTVAITAGLILKRIQLRHFLTIAFFFGAFQALMPLAGWAGSFYFYRFIEHFDHWIAFSILIFLGIKMIREGIQDGEDNQFDPTNSELAGAITESGSDSYITDYNTEGFFGRIMYDYDNRYYGQVSYRRDASSRFHPDNR